MNRGFSLVELMVALLLLQMGVLATVGMVHLAQENTRRADHTLRSVLSAGWTADSLARSASAGPGRATYPWGELVWSATPEPFPTLRVAAWSPRESDTLAVLLALPLPISSVSPWPDSVALDERW